MYSVTFARPGTVSPQPFVHASALRAGYYHNEWVCSRPIWTNIQQLIACSLRPMLSSLPLLSSSGLLGPLQWMCTVAPVGINREEKDGFPPSPQRTLSQTWPLSPPDLTLKWACKEYVLEQEEKTTRLKTPRRENKSSDVHLIIACLSVLTFQRLLHKSQPNDKLFVCSVIVFCSLILIDAFWLCLTFPHTLPLSASGIALFR